MSIMNKLKKRVLIVEDDLLLAEVYKNSLKAEGIKAVTAPDYNSAMAKFSPQRFDLVILDIILKGKNGFELLRDFRKVPQGDKVPVIVITGMNTQQVNMDRDLMVSLNILGIYTKSQFSIDRFVRIVTSQLKRNETV